MQDQNDQTQTPNEAPKNVVSLFGDRKIEKKAELAHDAVEAKSAEDEESFMDVMKRNKMVQDRLRQERLKANKSVLKSYKIKN